MDKVNAAFIDLLYARKNSAIEFSLAGQNETYSAKIYWEHLNRLKEAIDNQLSSFNFWVNIVVKDKNVIQIEVFAPEQKPPEYTPYATFQFGWTADLETETRKSFNSTPGGFSYMEHFQDYHILDAEQIHAVFDNLIKDMKSLYNPLNLQESIVPYWNSILSKKFKSLQK